MDNNSEIQNLMATIDADRAQWEKEVAELRNKLTPNANDYKLVAEFLMHYMDMDTRAKLMNELPGAYNRILGYEVVKVTRTSDNTRIGQ